MESDGVVINRDINYNLIQETNGQVQREMAMRQRSSVERGDGDGLVFLFESLRARMLKYSRESRRVEHAAYLPIYPRIS